jgi:hypothetical protein
MHLRTGVGVVALEVWHGQDRSDGHWGCPMRERWGLRPHQQMSPWLEEKLAFTATATGSYEEVVAVAEKWSGVKVEASTVHRLVQQRGGEAEQKMQERLQSVPAPLRPQRAASELAVFQLDGWLVRLRGPGWGKKRTKNKRVEWHELKMGVFYFIEQSTAVNGRGLLTEKVVVSWRGEPMELGRRLHWEALRRGFGAAKWVVVIADGSPWIWNVKADRWADATEILDFYHASEHLWALGKLLYGEEGAPGWVEERLHRLRHGQEGEVLKEIAALKEPKGEVGAMVGKEKNYFAGQAERMRYQEFARRGWPLGSGAVESSCRQKQCRFKRAGQSWTDPGLRHLGALIEARHNGHWHELSFAT